MDKLFECQHCHRLYHWRKSTSSYLKMTYCTSMCERAEAGFTIDALLQVTRKPRTLSFIEKEMIGQALDEMQDWEEWLGKEV